jgi:hypothetical protein
MNKSSIEHHVKHLEEKHRELDQKIKIEYIKYGSDSVVHNMKKQKLHLKEEIERYKRQLETV